MGTKDDTKLLCRVFDKCYSTITRMVKKPATDFGERTFVRWGVFQ